MEKFKNLRHEDKAMVITFAVMAALSGAASIFAPHQFWVFLLISASTFGLFSCVACDENEHNTKI